MKLREPGLNEQRCIARHDLGFYRGLAVAGIYRLPSHCDVVNLVHRAVTVCVDRHPILGAVIDHPDTERPAFSRLNVLDVKHHVILLQEDTLVRQPECDEETLVQETIQYVLNAKFEDVRQVPPWRVFVVRLQGPSDQVHSDGFRTLLVFNYSHSHGDGTSGLAFHRTLFEAMRTCAQNMNGTTDDVIRTTERQLPATPEPLPISWHYLGRVLVQEFFPWMRRLRFWEAPAPRPWSGAPAFFDPDNFQTAARVIRIPQQTMAQALIFGKEHGLKLTALLHLFIVRSLTIELRRSGVDAGAFISGTPIDLRKLFGLDGHSMGVNASSVSFQHVPAEAGTPLSVVEIEAGRELTLKLAQSVSTKQDQVIGLLKYARPLRRWHQGKLGKTRDSSYEVSNLMVFDSPGNSVGSEPLTLDVTIERISFAQPADAGGVPITFNVVSLKGGELSIVVSWQVGAVGLSMEPSIDVERTERDFVERVTGTIQDEIEKLARSENGSVQ